MSITFYASTTETREWDGQDVEVIVHAPDADGLELNVSNSNGADLLSFLGLEFDYCGTVSAEVVLGACLVADAVAPMDPGHEGGADPRNPRMIECGRRPGYLNERAAQLRVIAQYAHDHGHAVSWA